VANRDSSQASADTAVPLSRPSDTVRYPGGKRLACILTIVVAGFVGSLIVHYERGVVHKAPYPLNTFLFRPDYQFTDLTNYYVYSQNVFDRPVESRQLVAGLASPFMMLCGWLLYVTVSPNVAWWLITAFFFAALVLVVRRAILLVQPDMVWPATIALTLCSYPVWFSVDRSNLEELIFVLLLAMVVAYQRRRYLTAALLLGVMIASKSYGVVFLVLFVSDRRYKETLLAIAAAIVLTLAALWVLPGDFVHNSRYFAQSLAAYSPSYVIGNEGLYFGSSLWGLLKIIFYSYGTWVQPDLQRDLLALAVKPYFYFAATVFAGVAGLICLCRMDLWKKVALLLCSMNLLPYVCADYRLVHFFVPMLLFITNPQPRHTGAYFAVLFGLLLVPTGYFHFEFDRRFGANPGEAADSVVLHPLLMLLLVAGLVTSTLRNCKKTEIAGALRAMLPQRFLRPQR
jgi:hypothetical protein